MLKTTERRGFATRVVASHACSVGENAAPKVRRLSRCEVRTVGTGERSENENEIHQ